MTSAWRASPCTCASQPPRQTRRPRASGGHTGARADHFRAHLATCLQASAQPALWSGRPSTSAASGSSALGRTPR
eukprot:13313655-Alexandrium_andersonii.AAC.1